MTPPEASGGREGARGRFIVFEGPDASGKSLQIGRLSRRLRERGVAHAVTREPGGTEVGEALRKVILAAPHVRLDGVTELLLFSAARRAHVEEVIRPALERGEIVLCDRFELSTRVYQGCARGVPAPTIRQVTEAATGGLRPDVYLLIDVPAHVGAERRKAEGAPPDRIEAEKGLMEKVRAGYLEFVTEDGVAVVDGTRTPDEVEEEIAGILRARFPAGAFAGDGGSRH